MFTLNHIYLRSKRGRLWLPLQMQLYGKTNVILLLFYCIFGIYIKFLTFPKKLSFIASVALKLLTPKDMAAEMHNMFCSENSFRVNMLWVPKTAQICRKAILSHFFILLSIIKLEKIILSQIWDLKTAY